MQSPSPSHREPGLRLKVDRLAVVPDPVRLARYRRAPELGPKILFFSGGSALREVCPVLAEYTHNSIHLITPFDSGGSSARLRDVLPIISVGDLRNRLVALSDADRPGHAEVRDLFAHRLGNGDVDALSRELACMASGDHPLVTPIPRALRRLICTHLRMFSERIPRDFDLRGASIGNLVLAGGYLVHDHDLEAVLFLFSQLVQVRGFVRPVVSDDLHLVAELEDGTRLCGQHRITAADLDRAPIHSIALSRVRDRFEPAACRIDPTVEAAIASADLVCLPMGSFFTSVLACLLPSGVPTAIARAGCPIVYVPNTGVDTEQRGISPARAVEMLNRELRREGGSRGVDFVLADRERGHYLEGIDSGATTRQGATLLDLSLVDDVATTLDPPRLVEALASLA